MIETKFIKSEFTNLDIAKIINCSVLDTDLLIQKVCAQVQCHEQYMPEKIGDCMTIGPGGTLFQRGKTITKVRSKAVIEKLLTKNGYHANVCKSRANSLLTNDLRSVLTSSTISDYILPNGYIDLCITSGKTLIANIHAFNNIFEIKCATGCRTNEIVFSSTEACISFTNKIIENCGSVSNIEDTTPTAAAADKLCIVWNILRYCKK